METREASFLSFVSRSHSFSHFPCYSDSHSHAHTHTHTYTHTPIHTYTHTHTPHKPTHRYYSQFETLNKDLMRSQFTFNHPLPPKHPLGLSFKKKILSRDSSSLLETPFLKERMKALDTWICEVIAAVDVLGLDEVLFLDTFFDAFNEKFGKAILDRSMYHTLKKCRVGHPIYMKLWNDGYTNSTLATIPREVWQSFGVAQGSIEQIEAMRMNGMYISCLYVYVCVCVCVCVCV